jgi:hypothetical protein
MQTTRDKSQLGATVTGGYTYPALGLHVSVSV